MKIIKKLGNIILISLLLTGCMVEVLDNDESNIVFDEAIDFVYEDVLEYDGRPYVEVNGNVPYFTEEEITDKSFEDYGELDYLGRCTISTACLSLDTMPSIGDERGSIGNIKPSGWYSKKYDCVEGKYVMNRSHCIGWQLSNENENVCNLISGSRYLNLEMQVFENMVADYLRETSNHVMYRVTPVFVDRELLCRGLLMEGYSVEDKGEGISFCVFFYNVQPGIEFDYATGESWYTGVFLDTDSPAVIYEVDSSTAGDAEEESLVSPLPEEGQSVTYILNRKSLKFHIESCTAVAKMEEHNKEVFEGNREYLISIGYVPCGNCKP